MCCCEYKLREERDDAFDDDEFGSLLCCLFPPIILNVFYFACLFNSEHFIKSSFPLKTKKSVVLNRHRHLSQICSKVELAIKKKSIPLRYTVLETQWLPPCRSDVNSRRILDELPHRQCN